MLIIFCWKEENRVPLKHYIDILKFSFGKIEVKEMGQKGKYG